MQQIGSVIRNPEVLALVPALLDSLMHQDATPAVALHSLIHTQFTHSVDPPSLALIVPIIRHGLRDRAAASKKMAAQIVGSLCRLTNDVRDLLPYTPTLRKHLQVILMDPIPEVRTVASRALGSIYKGVWESFLVPLSSFLISPPFF